jgi:catechol 2,3-dioxygenase-like lactoylglutathione lyase family enzyme
MAEFPAPMQGILLTHFIVSDDVDRSRRFYTDVLGGEPVREGEPSMVALANGWIIINAGGGPTKDKPTVTLETPPNPDRVSSFLNIRVADIEAVYADWSARGAEFLTPPVDHGREIRCYVRDPDGHLIEVGQATGILEGGRASRVDPQRTGSPAHRSSEQPASQKPQCGSWLNRMSVRAAPLSDAQPRHESNEPLVQPRPEPDGEGPNARPP